MVLFNENLMLMRYILIFTLFLFTFSCSKKDIQQTDAIADFAASAKEWWIANVPEASGKDLVLNWENAKLTNGPLGMKVLEVPLTFPKQTLGAFNRSEKVESSEDLYTYKSLLLYKKPETGFYYGVFSMIGSENYSKSNAPKLNSYSKVDPKFEGIVLIESLDGKLFRGGRYVNGKRKELLLEKPKAAVNGTATDATVTCDVIEVTYYQVVRVGDRTFPPVVLRTETYLTNCTVNQDDGPVTPIDYPDPTDMGGGEGTIYHKPVYREVINDLTNPCAKAMLEKVMGNDASNDIQTLFNREFGTSDVSIKFIEESLPMNVAGETTQFVHQVGSNYKTVWISLNSNVMKNASQEYIAATIIHELMHAFAVIKNERFTRDHEDMDKNTVAIMASALNQLFPNMSMKDATALAWGGVYDTSAWKELVAADPTTANHYRILDTYYSDGTSGTKCE